MHSAAPSVRWTLDPNDARGSGFNDDGADGGGMRIAGTAGEELTIKKSRFVGYASHSPSWRDARSSLDALRIVHPRSRHICYGYVSSDGTVRSSDDGEPSGTAGPPILDAIRTEDLFDVLCVVVRYYGGIRLGTGGLVRAYGSVARGALRNSRKVALSSRSRTTIVTRASYVGIVRSMLSRHDGMRLTHEVYDEHGDVEWIVEHDDADGEWLRMDLMDATRGDARFL